MNTERHFHAYVLVATFIASRLAFAQVAPEEQMPTSGYTVAEIYSDLRNQVLGLKWEGAGTDLTPITAVLMETGYPDAVATLVAVSDGTASLYFSNGGGIVGAGEHELVRSAVNAFLAVAAGYLPQAALADTFPLPAVNRVRFYFVTVRGVYTTEALEDDLGYERHSFSKLFFAGHDLIAAIREHDPQ